MDDGIDPGGGKDGLEGRAIAHVGLVEGDGPPPEGGDPRKDVAMAVAQVVDHRHRKALV